MVVEGDAAGKYVLENDPAVVRRLVARFGEGILDGDGHVLRSELGQSAFASREATEELTHITTEPLLRYAFGEMDRLGTTHPVIVFDAALIYEWGIEDRFDTIVVVTAPEEKLLTLASARLGLSKEAVAERLHRQMGPCEKARRADFVLGNDGDLDALRVKASRIWETITKTNRALD